jgi:hypothetical protein
MVDVNLEFERGKIYGLIGGKRRWKVDLCQDNQRGYSAYLGPRREVKNSNPRPARNVRIIEVSCDISRKIQ